MNKRFLVIAFIAGTIVATPPASAGPFTDELSRCLVRNTTDADRELLIRWIYIAMSLHPTVESLATVDQETAEEAARVAADLSTDLIADRCKSEAVDAIRYDGQAAFEASFAVLGQVAMQGIMSNPRVGSYLGEMEQYLDVERLEEAFSELDFEHEAGN